MTNLFAQEQWARRGENDIQLQAALARVAALEAKSLLWTQRHACRALTSSATSCPSGAQTKITLNLVDYDDSGAFRTGSSDYLVPQDGLYFISGTAHVDQMASQQAIGINIYVGGSAFYGSRYTAWAGDMIGLICTVTDQINLNAGQTVDIRLENNDTAGGAHSANVSALSSLGLPRLVIHRMGPKAPSTYAT